MKEDNGRIGPFFAQAGLDLLLAQITDDSIREAVLAEAMSFYGADKESVLVNTNSGEYDAIAWDIISSNPELVDRVADNIMDLV